MKEALRVLQEAAGPSYPMLFLKLGVGEWTPVGREMLYSLVKGKAGTEALVVCDSEGNSKAMSGWLAEGKARECAVSLEAKGLPRYTGDVKLPV